MIVLQVNLRVPGRSRVARVVVAAMTTPDGAWRVEVLRPRSGEVFQVHRRAVIGLHGGAGWALTGQIRRTVTEVQALLGGAFADLTDV